MKTKYPRSYHLPGSKTTSDDKQHHDDKHFHDKNVVVTIKMDGENTTIYNDFSHARSMDSQIDSEDRRWIEALRQSKIEGIIPNDFRICGENMFWKHTCFYDDLDSMFLVFSIWEGDKCLSWDETKMWCNLLGLSTVPVLYEGIYNKDLIFKMFSEYIKGDKNVEGFVIRLEDEFNMSEFSKSLSKYVRKSFVIPSQHWRYSKKTPNQLVNNQNPWEII
jgi:RNA ligase